MASAYLERIDRRYRGRRHPYYFLTVRNNGRRKRKYIRFRDVLDVMDILEMQKRKKRQGKEPDRRVSEPRDRSFFPRHLKIILNAAGYSVCGSALERGKNFLSKSAARVRFGLLDRESRERVGSPENLLRINTEALSLLKRRNRYGMKTSYEQCVSDVIDDFTMVDQ